MARCFLVLPRGLDVSWFYPEGFRKERVVETQRSLIVIGDSLAYKFLKPDPYSGPIVSFAERWRKACEEIRSNRELAPDLYFGVRLLRWIDEEPQWITEYRGNDLDPNNAPLDADEVAIVMQRIPAGVRLPEILLREEVLSRKQIGDVVDILANFHMRRKREAIRYFVDDPEARIDSLEDRVLGESDRFMRVYGSFLDPFSQAALREASSYLKGHFEGFKNSLFTRGQQGLLLDYHGDLRQEKICLEPIREEARAISIFGRVVRPGRFGDVLEDLASLNASLAVRQHHEVADGIVAAYRERRAEVFDESLFRFYTVSALLHRAQHLFLENLEKNAFEAQVHLALALRHSLGIERPFVLGVGGGVLDQVDEVAKSVAELLGIPRVHYRQFAEGTGHAWGPDELVFERMMRSLEDLLRSGTAAVIVWPLNRAEERLKLAALARRFQALNLSVKCERGGIGAIDSEAPQQNRSFGEDFPSRRLWHADSESWNETSREAPYMLLEPSLAPHELALLIARGLRDIAANCEPPQKL